ncbi:MAG: InlB B-repeat-containing protein [Clostridium sp.]|nr:InlB B-repeat-containing protein [Clostridium sp.]
MRKSVKKVISGVLAGMMILTAAPISAMAADYQLGDVIADSDLCAPQTLQPKIDVVWTPYTGKGAAFVNDGDESWVADGTTVNDLSKHSVEGKTVEELPSNSKYGNVGFVACTFILRDTAGQFGATQFKFTWDSALTIGNRMGNTGSFKTTPAFEGTGADTLYNSNWEPYMTDDASALSTTDAYISFGNPLDANNDDAAVTRWVGETSSIGDPDAGTVIDGLYICTIGFKVKAGTTISDDLLHFERAEYCSIPYNAFGTDVPYLYTLTGRSWSEGTPVGTIECPMKASAPETKSYTVNYVTEDGASLGTENVEEGKSPASVPDLPTKAPDATGHYSYAWDTDPATATISADTTFTAKLTTTPHTAQTLDSDIVDATCGKDGSKTVTTSCSKCGYVISVEHNVVIPATNNHTPAAAVKENVKPATCETAETYDSVVYCSVCNKEISRTQMTGEAALGHKWGEWKHDDSTTKAESQHTRTCARDASHTESAACNFTSQVTQNQTADLPEITTYTCQDCGYSYTEETKPALGHTHNYGAPVADYTSGQAFVEGKNYTHTATCTGEGTCSQPTKTDACTFDNGVETKAATCTEDGVKTFTCTECGGTYTVAIPATNHAWGQWKHDAATAEAKATHTRVCANDASHKETKACDFTATVTQEATLDQAEITTYTCKDCGYSYTKETAPALAGVTVTVNAVENGSVTLAGQDVTAGGSKKFAENGTYTLVATPNENCTFVGWQTGNKIVSTDATYTTVAIADITYTPVFAESAKPVQFTFVDMFNNVISSQSVASGADVKIPQAAPTYTGYTFTGWSADEATIKAATSSMTVYAQYEKDAAATYTVTTDADATVAYGSNSAQGTLADVPYGTQVTVSKAGATAWAIDGKIVAYGDSYTFYVASDVTVKAASATTQAPVVAAVSANQVAGSYKVEFVATRAMVDGCTYLKSGFVYGKNLTDADLTLANVGKQGSADNSGVVKAAYANSTEGSTQFILSYGISAQTGTASAKAFLTYRDQNGKVKTVYSDVMNHTYA